MYTIPHLVLPQVKDLHRIDVYTANGGYDQIRKVLSGMSPDDVINEVKASGLRGRGGACFSSNSISTSFTNLGPYTWLQTGSAEPICHLNQRVLKAYSQYVYYHPAQTSSVEHG